VFVSRPLADADDLTAFDSGNDTLDTWLADHARTAQAKRVSRTFVWTDRDRVVGYYTISAHLLRREDLPTKLARGNPTQIPAVLLGRLALDRSLHGQGHGGELLADALRRVVTATETVAARFVVVDAIDESAFAFYRHHGFAPIPQTDRLVQKLTDVAAALAGEQQR
jgi:GNAT superfamily N-acetyltransferase